MWEWLMWGHQPKPRAGYLAETVDRLLATGPQAGEDAFPLPEKEIKRLCNAAREALLKEPSLLEIRTAARTVVVGDLHGQYTDLQRIFARLGRPGSDDKVWVFLGDYIDRGPMGLEIVATLLLLKLRHPESIYLLRGNHECSEITVLFGFCGECQRRSTLAAWEAVMQVFDALPLAALLNGRVFLCHGGISPYLKRPQDVNAIRRPLDVNPNGEGLLTDLLWADPSPTVAGWCPNPRGVSFVFGLDVAQEWLRSQGLRAIVRAHMVQQQGFEVLGSNEVMTVFSASDYRESGNTGAVLLIDPSLDFEFVTFPALRAASLDADSPRLLVTAAAASADGAGAHQPVPADKFGSPLPAHAAALAGMAESVSLPPQQRRSPFAAAAGQAAPPVGPAAAAVQQAPESAGPAAAEAAPTPAAAQALQQEVEEDRLVIESVSSDKELASLVHRGSAGLQQLEALTHNSRVPAEALARASASLS
ncbi:hypothetical protein ABPG75_013110 [Micractinium tetrahymenae]